MNITRTITTTVIDVPKVESVGEAETVMKAVLEGKVAKGDRDAANGLVEAFFMSYFRQVPKGRGALLTAINNLQGTFGKYNPFLRALSRTKAYRPKNDAWNSVKA